MYSDLELMTFELQQSKCKWLLLRIDKPPSPDDIEILNRICSILDYMKTYENIMTIDDFNLIS